MGLWISLQLWEAPQGLEPSKTRLQRPQRQSLCRSCSSRRACSSLLCWPCSPKRFNLRPSQKQEWNRRSALVATTSLPFEDNNFLLPFPLSHSSLPIARLPIYFAHPCCVIRVSLHSFTHSFTAGWTGINSMIILQSWSFAKICERGSQPISDFVFILLNL